jgi:hypothetical protein
MKLIELTKGERSAVEWALEPMRDYWCTESGAYDRDGKQYTEADLPSVSGSVLVLSEVDEINSDLHYRTTVQLADMAEQTAGDGVSVQGVAGQIAICERLSTKLKVV